MMALRATYLRGGIADAALAGNREAQRQEAVSANAPEDPASHRIVNHPFAGG
jgi:hypothetical protein